MSESEEQLKSLLTNVKEESETASLKLDIQKSKIMATSPMTSWQVDGTKMETMVDFIFLGSMQGLGCPLGVSISTSARGPSGEVSCSG